MNRPQEMTRVRRQADLVLMAVLVASSCAAIAIGVKFETLGTLTTALVAGVAGIGAAAFLLARGSTASMFTLALTNAAMVALHIQLGRGTVEFHFGVFVLLGLLLVHRDWRTIVAGAAFFAVHHILFDRLQAAGFGTYCIPKADFLTVVLHATYVVVQTGIELALAMQLRQAALESAETTALVAAVDRDGELHLDIRGLQADTRLGASLKSVLGSMGQSVARVSHASRSIEASITEIASGNQDLNQRTEQQASALQQTSATMEQLGATVRTNAQHAEQASSLAQEAATVAGRGGDVVGQVVSTMQGISQSSQKIGDITGVIDGIAFQTNILALNAAVEAARAGEVGRGFAVVATEVRALAQRSADAAKEIKSLISRNVEQVNEGNALVGEAGKTMADLVAAVQRVRGIVSEIAAASAEQRQGIDQVVDAVGQLDSATQQNAALVEQGASATESLKAQVLQLVAAVSAFKVGDGVAAQPA